MVGRRKSEITLQVALFNPFAELVDGLAAVCLIEIQVLRFDANRKEHLLFGPVDGFPFFMANDALRPRRNPVIYIPGNAVLVNPGNRRRTTGQIVISLGLVCVPYIIGKYPTAGLADEYACFDDAGSANRRNILHIIIIKSFDERSTNGEFKNCIIAVIGSL